MTYRIYIVRHGKAEAYCADDAGRALVSQGRENTRRLGLQISDLEPDRIWVSPYLRARQTLEELASVMGSLPEAEIHGGITPHGDAFAVMADILEAEVPCLMLVSHQPFVSDLASELLTPGVSLPAMGTSHLIEIELDNLSAGNGRLVRHLVP
jgi:phosphohistidine phosphatase